MQNVEIQHISALPACFHFLSPFIYLFILGVSYVGLGVHDLILIE
jgi:hypothetical protein